MINLLKKGGTILKNNILKKLLLFMGVVALAAVFTGCGKKTNASSVKHITYWHVNAQTQGGATVDDLVKKFKRNTQEYQSNCKIQS
jgi:ABC-type sugar transport system, periplasmic component